MIGAPDMVLEDDELRVTDKKNDTANSYSTLLTLNQMMMQVTSSGLKLRILNYCLVTMMLKFLRNVSVIFKTKRYL